MLESITLNLLPASNPCGATQLKVLIPVAESYDVEAILTEGATTNAYWVDVIPGSPAVFPIAIWFFAGTDVMR